MVGVWFDLLVVRCVVVLVIVLFILYWVCVIILDCGVVEDLIGDLCDVFGFLWGLDFRVNFLCGVVLKFCFVNVFWVWYVFNDVSGLMVLLWSGIIKDFNVFGISIVIDEILLLLKIILIFIGFLVLWFFWSFVWSNFNFFEW